MTTNLHRRSRVMSIFAVLIVAMLVLASCSEDPELIGTDMDGQQAPPFHLIDHRGQEVRLSDLQGKAVALTFIFTNCPDVCPLIVNRMRLAYEELPEDKKDNVALVAITVDPERDTVEAMQEYSEARGMGDIDNWYALTAPLEVLEPLWEAYFVTPGQRYPADPDVVEAMESGEHDPEEFVEEQGTAAAGDEEQDDHEHDEGESDHDHENGEEEDGTAYWLAHTDVIYFIDTEGNVQVLLRGDYTPDDLARNLEILAP